MARNIQERIKKLIIDERLPSGAPLPTEPELMKLLGVSRNSVREALKALQAIGLVDIRHGFGTYVGPMSLAPMSEGLAFRTVAGHHRGEDSLRQLLELREAMEIGLVAQHACKLPEEELAVLEALVDRMDAMAEAGAELELAETDRRFHAALYRGLRNPLLGEVLEAFWDAFHQVQRDLMDVPQDPRVTCRKHRDILEAVRSGDVLRAERTMRDHFDHLRTRVGAAAQDRAPDRAPGREQGAEQGRERLRAGRPS
ncbi:FadR family transcriptional regulator [Streptomyces sp. NA04227]|uniref:FadR/GntR family transcriptional regulator n=1 Tax=Streptomyces sp. NA04227 TaxID=2742136 RepID=UPI0015912862|nr:FadR/GntR family transcriptional regulator [Streptomyces sp. NA04227]QKW06702.1 FadR family transcriptional regulator [Streptomyces sp. NA04227]